MRRRTVPAKALADHVAPPSVSSVLALVASGSVYSHPTGAMQVLLVSRPTARVRSLSHTTRSLTKHARICVRRSFGAH